MAMLDNLEVNFVTLLQSLMDDEDFVKLISIDSPDALTESPTDDFYSLFNDRLLLIPKNNYPISEEKSYISIYLAETSRSRQNDIKHNDIDIIVDISSHLNLWLLEDNTIRVYRIIDIIYENFVEAKIKGVRGNLIHNRTKITKFNDKFMGYSMFFTYTGSTGCK